MSPVNALREMVWPAGLGKVDGSMAGVALPTTLVTS
jgi:hypothetical protein